jgi:muramoyltetrapeptide carboxypeptidase
VRGGYGSGRVADLLDYALIARNAKIFVGYSDITNLLMPMHGKAGLVTFHGPVGTDLASRRSEASIACLFEVLGGVRRCHHLDPAQVDVLRPGTASGPLVGGNLSVLSTMVGAPGFRIPPGAIVFLEDVNEFMYQQDRCLVHLRRAGVFDSAAAVLIADTPVKDPGCDNSLGLSYRDMVAGALRGFPGPVVCQVPCGHTDTQLTLPFGAHADLTAAPDGVRLEFTCPFDPGARNSGPPRNVSTPA